MALTVAELNTRLTADTRNLEAGLRRAQGDVNAFAAGGGAAMKAFGGAVAGVVASEAFRALQELLVNAVRGASDLAEAANATGVAFQGATPQVVAWANSLSSAFGATTTEALNAASQFQLVTREAGLTGDQVTDLAERAFDLGSVFNQSAADVSTAIKAGLVGETEPLRRFGVILNQDKIEAEALAMGLIGLGDDMTAGEKQAASYSLIMRETASAQGDAEATAETAAGQMRQLRVNVDELQVSIGAFLLPAFTSVTNFINSALVPAFGSLLNVVGDNVQAIANFIEGPLGRVAGVLDAVGLDGFAEDLRGVEGAVDRFGKAALNMDDAFFSLKDTLVETNAAGGAAAMTQKGLASDIDRVTDSAKEAAKAAQSLKDAFFSLGDADFALQDSQRAAAEAQDELNVLLATAGVDADKVKTATADLAQANEDLASATARAADAQQKLAEEQQDVVDAQAKLAKLQAQKKARDEAIKNARAQLAAADTVTERIIAQESLDAALGMEIVTDQELAAAQRNVETQQGQVTTATDRLTEAQGDVTTATDAVTVAQQNLNTAQQPAPGFAKQVEEAQRAVERANWDVEKATWAAEKAQRAYNDALNATPRNVTTTVNRVENITENRRLNVDIQLPALPASGSGTVVPLQMRPTLVMHDGGMVPGPRGADVPALLEAGERVIPAGRAGGMGGVTIIVEGSVITERDLGRVVADAIRDNGLYGVN